MENIREAASAVYKSTEHSTDSVARQQAVDLLNEPDVKANLDQVTQQLESTGTLPQLVISEFDRLDSDHNGSISAQDLKTVLDNKDTDALTRMAAEYANKKWDGINDADDNFISFMLPDNEIIKSELNTFRDNARNNRTLEPNEIYKAERVINDKTPESELNDLLTSNASSPQEQLKAVEALLAQGKSSFKMTDLDGNQYDVSINVETLKDGTKMIALFANDDGHTYPLLRGNGRNGVYSQQTDENGPVSWYGKKWSKMHTHSAFAPTPLAV